MTIHNKVTYLPSLFSLLEKASNMGSEIIIIDDNSVNYTEKYKKDFLSTAIFIPLSSTTLSPSCGILSKPSS